MNLDQIKQILENKKILDDKVDRANKAISDIISDLENTADGFGIPFCLHFSPIAQAYHVEISEEMEELLENDSSSYDKELKLWKYDSIAKLTDDTTIIQDFAELMDLSWESEYGETGWTHSGVC